MANHKAISSYEIDGNIAYRSVDGGLHNPAGPARRWKDGSWEWYYNGSPHRYYGYNSSWFKNVFIHGKLIK